MMTKNAKHPHQTKQLAYPESVDTAFYTPDDVNMLHQLIDYLNQQRLPQTWLAKAAGVDKALINRLIKGNYNAPTTPHLKKILATIKNHTERKNTKQIPFIETQLYKIFCTTCNWARTERSMAAFTALAGTGKTRAMEEYTKNNPNTVYIEPNPLMSQNALLDELVDRLRATVKLSSHYAKGTRESRFRGIVEKLKGSDTLIIMDEANTASNPTIENLRRFHDLGDIGVVLVGTDALHAQIHSQQWQFDQLRNRITMWPQTIEKISDDECQSIAKAGLAAYGEIPETVLQRLKDYHAGNLRVLTEQLIPAIIKFGLRQGHELSVALVNQIAKSALSITPVVTK